MTVFMKNQSHQTAEQICGKLEQYMNRSGDYFVLTIKLCMACMDVASQVYIRI